MEALIISACFLKDGYKYNGGNNKLPITEKLKEKYDLFIVCPEVFGGLSSPRFPSEIKKDKVINSNGEDVTENYITGALKSLEIVKKSGATKALLKAKSPSCGKDYIYDGSFSHKLVNGDGVFAKMLKEIGISIYTEEEVEKLL